jgi:sialate O-acetylesterase
MNARLVALLALPSLSVPPAGELRLPSLFGDHMVLQRETDAPLWGWAAPASEISVEADFLASPLHARADAQGAFRVDLKTGKAGGPHRIHVKAGSEERVLDDLWFGEVWIASGQSNMEWPMTQTQDGAAEIADANRPMIRIFDAVNTLAFEPAEDVPGSWQIVSPETIRDFSAVAYFFGRDLEDELEVPIGLIGSNWGGTPAEAWTSESALRPFGDFDPVLDRIVEERGNPQAVAERAARALQAWWERVPRKDEGSRVEWGSTVADDSGWEERAQPGQWSGDLESFDGIVWMRRAIEIPAAWEGKELVLELGPIDDMDTTWFQGVRVGGIEVLGQFGTPRSYAVPPGLVHAGRAVVAVRVVDITGPGGMAGDADALRLFPKDGSGGRGLSLAGAWRTKKGAALADLGAVPSGDWFNSNTPTSLFNGMIAPLAPYAIRGAIWYQGESNVGRAEQYARLFPAMITDWRREFARGDFPFYFVQIAPFGYGNDKGEAAELRDAQRRSLATPNTGMVVTLDIGDPADIHPRNKQEVGRRLALLALSRTYGKSGIVDSGPLYLSHAVEGAAIRVRFDHAAGGLVAKGGDLTCFEIAGEDGRFVAGNAKVDGETVVVSSPAVSAPRRVRFAWSAVAQPNLFNAAGLPASSFTCK